MTKAESISPGKLILYFGVTALVVGLALMGIWNYLGTGAIAPTPDEPDPTILTTDQRNLLKQGIIPVGTHIKDWAPITYLDKWNNKDYMEEADLTVDHHVFKNNPLDKGPIKTVRCEMEILQQQIKDGAAWFKVTNTASNTTIMTGARLTELVREKKETFWIAIWQGEYGDATPTNYAGASITHHWKLIEVNTLDCVRLEQGDPASDRDDFHGNNIFKPGEVGAVVPMSKATLTFVSSTDTVFKFDLKFDETIDADDTNDRGTAIEHADQPVVVKFTMVNYAAGDQISSITWDGDELVTGKVEGSGVWWAIIDMDVLGGHGYNLEGEIEVTYACGNTDETLAVAVYCGGFNGHALEPAKYKEITDLTLAAYLGPSMGTLSAVNLF